MTSREAILAAVRAKAPTSRAAVAEVPLFENPSHSLLDDFRDALIRMGGKFAELQDGGDLDGLIGSRFPQAKVICSATAELVGTRALAVVSAIVWVAAAVELPRGLEAIAEDHASLGVRRAAAAS